MTDPLVKFPEITVELTGGDGNAMVVIAGVARALRRAGHADQVRLFMDEAMAADYDHVLRTAMRWVNVT